MAPHQQRAGHRLAYEVAALLRGSITDRRGEKGNPFDLYMSLHTSDTACP
jgi:hypothetical protein